jgi:gliding motility-associated-like protein
MEQGEERSIRLQYTGGDANSKTAFISSLPSQGSLYQYISGSKGTRITTVPATVSDADFNVIYSADGGSGNGAGSFNFYIHDNTGDSPVATTTINVNPPGVPNFLLAAKAGDIEIQFDKPMADPTGKESQFTVKVNGTPVTISSVSLKSGDPYTIVVSLATPLTGSETVLISYTQGDVVSESGGSLPSFVDQPVNFLRQTITFPALLEMTYGDEPVTLTASASSGLPVTFISSNTSVASVTGTTLTANSPGSVNITAQQVGNGTYAPARYIRILVVNKADQVITFPTFPEKRFGDPDFSPGAASSSGLAVTYSSSDESVATIVNNNIRITGSGSAVITASQEGNNLYNPANNVTATLIIDKSNQTITFNVLPTKLVGDADFSPGATSTSGLEITYTSSNTGVATVNGNLIHLISAGTTTITASQPGNTNYNAATPAAQVLTVEKGSQTITFNTLPEVTYGDPDFSPGATASSSLTITYTSSNTSVAVISAGLIHITGAGLSVITASQAGDDDFSSAPDVQQTLTVDKASQSITFGEMPTRVFGDADFNPAATASSGLVVTYSSSNTNVASITGNSIHITGAGTAVITASQAGDNNYLEAPDISHSLTVQKAAQTITFPELPYGIYGGADILPAATASSGLEVSYSSSNQSVAAISDGRIQITGAGTVIITASQAGNDNYEAASGIQRTLIIGKADQTITFGAITSLPYGSSDFNPGATATSGLSINYSSSNTNVAVISGNMLHITGAGNATITASQPGDNNYNAAPDAAQLFVVAKADQSITFSQLSEHTFGDSPFNLNVSASSNLSVTFLSSDPVIASVSGTLVTIHRAGSVIITAHQPGDENYNAAPDVSQTLVVKKAGQSISFAPFDSHKFGDPDINPGAISSSGLGIKYSSSNTAIAIITGSLVHIVGAGTVNITASQEGNSDFEPAPDVTQTLTVDKADQTILFPPVDQVIYGTEPFNPRASSSSGLEVTYSSNNTAVADISGGMIGIKGAGTAVITALQEGDDNYNPAENEEQTLVVTKAMLIVTAGNQTKAYLATNPELTFTYSGFVYNENESVIDISPVVQTEALQDSPVGEYTVTLSGGSDNNYDFTYIAGVLTITRIPQTVTFTSFPIEILVNETFDLQAIASSGLSVSFESDNTQVALITGSILKGVSGGTVIIKAYQEGNENYSPAEATVSVEVIATHKNILNLFTPNNDGFNDHWEIPELDSYGKCDVRVYNRWGKLVFSSKDYHNEWDGKSDGVDLPEAAYYYILKTESFGTITGTVNIVR